MFLNGSLQSTVRHTFANFMAREGTMTYVQAVEEFEFLMVNNQTVTEEHYMYRVRRIGASVLLTRSQRQSVYMSFQNAINHSTFS